MQNISPLIARVFLGQLFLLAGLSKLGAYAATQGYMDAMGVPGQLLPLVIGLEIVGGLAVIIGWQARRAAFTLAGFSLISAVIFHHDFADQIQMIMFMKNVAIAGGFLMIFGQGAGAFSIDNRKKTANTQPTVSIV
ncbi:MAG: DoxX family protein [Gammaproteobacteria bacterium]|nr:MAG: DoxX family protein [Gammaproteobacteria bacterium]